MKYFLALTIFYSSMAHALLDHNLHCRFQLEATPSEGPVDGEEPDVLEFRLPRLSFHKDNSPFKSEFGFISNEQGYKIYLTSKGEKAPITLKLKSYAYQEKHIFEQEITMDTFLKGIEFDLGKKLPLAKEEGDPLYYISYFAIKCTIEKDGQPMSHPSIDFSSRNSENKSSSQPTKTEQKRSSQKK